jgi:hypothetical protein
LNLILRDLDLAYVIHDEVVLITTRDKANEMWETVVYDVLDLFDDGMVERRADLDYNSLIEVIISQIAPTSWEVDDIPTYFDGMLIVTQAQEVQTQIAQFFAALRKIRAARPLPAAPIDDPTAVSVRVYKVDVPLLPVSAAAKPAEPTAPRANEKAPAQTLHQFGGGWPAPKSAPAGVIYAPASDYLKALSHIIESSIEPESWEGAGGLGSIHSLPADAKGIGTLVVKQTGRVHAQIKQLIEDIEMPYLGFMGAGRGGF